MLGIHIWFFNKGTLGTLGLFTLHYILRISYITVWLNRPTMGG